jgi:RimJ/RimL family protein N-acetyltransferase
MVECNIRNLANKVGEIAYIINPNYWGRGYATEAARLTVEFGFSKLHCHRIFASCHPQNVGSAKVLKKIGMIQEGRLRENLLLRDDWRDSLLFSMLEKEWSASNTKTRK